MASEDEYEPSPEAWVRNQVEKYESSDGTKGTTLQGQPVMVITMRGAKSGKIRKVPLMKVEHDGVYAAVASLGGAPQNPVWFTNLVADPLVEVRDLDQVHPAKAREVFGEERELWWARAVEVWPAYADYQKKTSRVIPVFVLEPRD